ncbi:MAG TPA: hypothetical protein VII12_15230, partial [Thermoanaerobaculia bacterium]
MKRPYFFEVFTIVNFVLIQILLWRITRAPVAMLPRTAAILLPVFLIQTLIGVAIRIAIDRQKRRQYDVPWLIDTARIALFSVLSVHTYGWIKLSIPLLHASLFDQDLWNLDQAMFFGHSP